MGKRHKRRRMVNRVMPHKGPVLLPAPASYPGQAEVMKMAMVEVLRRSMFIPLELLVPAQAAPATEVALKRQLAFRRLTQMLENTRIELPATEELRWQSVLKKLAPNSQI